MVRHCSGGIILGFEQFAAPTGDFRAGSTNASVGTNGVLPDATESTRSGTPFSAGLPMMIFREPDIRGGVFDTGSTEVTSRGCQQARCRSRGTRHLDTVFQVVGSTGTGTLLWRLTTNRSRSRQNTSCSAKKSLSWWNCLPRTLMTSGLQSVRRRLDIRTRERRH